MSIREKVKGCKGRKTGNGTPPKSIIGSHQFIFSDFFIGYVARGVTDFVAHFSLSISILGLFLNSSPLRWGFRYSIILHGSIEHQISKNIFNHQAVNVKITLQITSQITQSQITHQPTTEDSSSQFK